MSDIELWQAWRDRGDASAFSSLVDRYLDMVYATARRILGNTHDAEEIAQECFITLLQGRVKVQHPLGPWLHRVARNRALDRIKGEARRRDRERAWHEDTLEGANESIDDILAHVDMAIDALPPELRATIVGRFLEGKTNVALGEALGVAESTIRFRVNRGVEIIREALKQRGVELRAAALGALLENNLAEAAPAGLRANVAKLCLAAPSPNVSPRWMAASKALVGLLTGLLLLGAVGYGLASGHLGSVLSEIDGLGSAEPVVVVSTQAMASEALVSPAEPPAAPRPVPSDNVETIPVMADTPPVPDWDEPRSTVSGTILDDRGYPLAGAIVTVASKFGPYEFERMQVFSAVTAADGTYTVDGIRHFLIWEGFSEVHRADQPVEHRGLHTYDTPNPYGVLHVHVSAPGFLTQGKQHRVEAGGHKRGIDYTMEPGVTMRGQVVWPDGKPTAHAGIGLQYFVASDGHSTREYNQIASTDGSGHFLLGVPAAGEVALLVIAGQQHAFFNFVPVEEHATPKLTMKPSTLLDGTVRKSDGTPVPELFITVKGRFGVVDDPEIKEELIAQDAFFQGHAFFASAHTDAQGKFAIPPMAAVPEAELIVFENIPDKPGKKLLTKFLGPLVPGERKSVEIVLPGASDTMTLIATVVGEQSGRDLPHTSVNVRHEATDKKLMMVPGFEKPYYPTEIDLTMPGTYLVWPHYNNLNMGEERDAYGQQVIWEGGTKKKITFRIPDPFSLSVTAVDTSGNPVPDASVECVGNNAGFRTDKTDEDGVFHWDSFAPNAPAYFRVSKEGFLTDETVAVVGAPMESVDLDPLVLHPSGGVEGRVVDADGALVANSYFQVTYTTEALTWRVRQEETRRVTQTIATDDAGTFVILDALPAAPGVVALQGMGPHESLGAAPSRPVEIVRGQVLDLGDWVLEAVESEAAK